MKINRYINFLHNSIHNDFINSIEKWGFIISIRLNISINKSYFYAIEEIKSLDDNDFFNELSLHNYKALNQFAEQSPRKLRYLLEDIFIHVADNLYDYGFNRLYNLYKLDNIKATD